MDSSEADWAKPTPPAASIAAARAAKKKERALRLDITFSIAESLKNL